MNIRRASRVNNFVIAEQERGEYSQAMRTGLCATDCGHELGMRFV